MCDREEIHANLRKTSEDVGLSNQCTTTMCIQKCANFSSMEAAEAMPTSKNFSSKCHKTQYQGSLLTGIDNKTIRIFRRLHPICSLLSNTLFIR